MRRNEAIRQAESGVDEQKRWIELEHTQLDINAGNHSYMLYAVNRSLIDAVEVKPPPTRRHLRRRQAGDDLPSDRRSFGAAISSVSNARDRFVQLHSKRESLTSLQLRRDNRCTDKCTRATDEHINTHWQSAHWHNSHRLQCTARHR